MDDCYSHPALEPLPLSEGECVCLGNDRNHINLIVNGLHKLNIQGFQAGWKGNMKGQMIYEKKTRQIKLVQQQNSPMTERGNEIEAAMNSIVNDVSAI